jgi:hypothetical protein
LKHAFPSTAGFFIAQLLGGQVDHPTPGVK